MTKSYYEFSNTLNDFYLLIHGPLAITLWSPRGSWIWEPLFYIILLEKQNLCMCPIMFPVLQMVTTFLLPCLTLEPYVMNDTHLPPQIMQRLALRKITAGGLGTNFRCHMSKEKEGCAFGD